MSTSSSCPVRKISPKRICYPRHTLAMPSAVARHPPSHHLRCASAARTRTSETSGQGWRHVPPSWGWTKGGLVHRHLSQLSGYPVELVPSTAIAHSIPILKICLARSSTYMKLSQAACTVPPQRTALTTSPLWWFVPLGWRWPPCVQRRPRTTGHLQHPNVSLLI